jgi:hypothetical protein
MAAWPRFLQRHCARFFEQNTLAAFCSMPQVAPNRSKVPFAGAVDKSEDVDGSWFMAISNYGLWTIDHGFFLSCRINELLPKPQ